MSRMIKNIFLMSICGLQTALVSASDAAELAALDRQRVASPVSSGAAARAKGPSQGAIASSVRSRSSSIDSSVRGRSDSSVSTSSEFDPRSVDLSGQVVTTHEEDIPADQRDNSISNEALYSRMRDYDNYYEDSRVTLPEKSSMGKITAISSKVAKQLQSVEIGLNDIYNPTPRPVSLRPALDDATGEYYYETTKAPILRWYFDMPAGKNAQTVKYTDFIFDSGAKHINGFKRVVNTQNNVEVEFLKYGVKNINVYKPQEDGSLELSEKYQVNDLAGTQIQIPINLASGKAPAKLQAGLLGRQESYYPAGSPATPRSRSSSEESTRVSSASPLSESSAEDSQQTGFSDLSENLADRPAQARHARYRLAAAKASYSDAQDAFSNAIAHRPHDADTSDVESYYDAARQELQSATEDSFRADMLNPERPVDVGTVTVPSQKPARAPSVSRRAASPARRSAAEQPDAASLNQLRVAKINSLLDQVYTNFDDAIFPSRPQSLKGQPGYGYFKANDGSRWYFKTSMIPAGKSLETVTYQDFLYDARGNHQNKFERVAFPKPDSSLVVFNPDGSYAMDVFSADNRTVSASYKVSADGRTLGEVTADAGSAATTSSAQLEAQARASLHPTPEQAARVAADPQLSYQVISAAHSALGITPGTQPSQATLESSAALQIKAKPARISFFSRALATLKRYFGYA